MTRHAFVLLALLSAACAGNGNVIDVPGDSGSKNSSDAGVATDAGTDGGVSKTPLCARPGSLCGSDGVSNGAPGTLYTCPAANKPPSQTTVCLFGCVVGGNGTDACHVPDAGAGPVCPGQGTYCGSDGVANGGPNTLYTCPGQGQAPTSTQYCTYGCNTQPTGTPDFCDVADAGANPICPGAGAWCGSDQVVNGNPNTLYQCPGAGQPPTSSAICPNGCQVEPTGTPDSCAGAGPVCPGQGAYCGSDGVTNGDANTLYQCPGTNLPPGSSTPCSSGCQVEPSGTPDFCKGTTPICPGVGAYCGSDGVQYGDSNTLYQCPGQGQAPSSSQTCPNGCSVQPAGTPDYCVGSNPVCPGNGAFCGSDGVQYGQANTLYQCPGQGQAPSSATACSAGCNVQPSGTPDFCNVTCPGAGAYCGSDGVQGGSSNTLYQCPGSGQAPTSATDCTSGCSVQPSGTPDYCNNSCSAFEQSALSYEASKIAAGEGGNCSGGPPYCYSDYCDGFVNDAYSYAGHRQWELSAYDAAAAMTNFHNAGNWHSWGGNCPCGAILFWAGNSCNGWYGHVVICNGDGTASTSGWTNFGGSTHASISWLNSMECGNAPAGYAVPQ